MSVHGDPIFEALTLLQRIVDRWTYDYHCCAGLQHQEHGTGVPAKHSPDCPLEAATVFLAALKCEPDPTLWKRYP